MKGPVKPPWKLILCLAAAGGNYLFHMVFVLLGIPLFMDTLFTVMVTFLAGPLWGCITAALTTLSMQLVYINLPGLLYVLCSISGVFLTWFFHRHYRLFEEEGQGAVISILLILTLYMCILMSITGGLISWLIPVLWRKTPPYASPESYYKLGMLLNRYPVLLAEIISRFPVNIPDRLLSVYGAYGFALLIKKALPPAYKNR